MFVQLWYGTNKENKMTREELIEDIKKTIPFDVMNAFLNDGGDLQDVAMEIEGNIDESSDDFIVSCMAILYREFKK